MIADLWDNDPPVSQVWLAHDVPQEPFDSRFPQFAHTHQGMDIALGMGSSIYATRTGVVGMVAYATMRLDFDDGTDMYLFHGDALLSMGTRFALNQVVYRTGNKVPGGGASTGPHLHVEMRPHGVPYNPTNNSLDPVPYLNFANKPAPAALPGHFSVTAKGDGGTWVHSKADITEASRVDLIDKDATLDCDGWAHAGPDVAAIPDWNTGNPGDDRMFRTSGHHYWIASSLVAGVPSNDSPEVKEAEPITPAPPPIVVPDPPKPVVTPPGPLSDLHAEDVVAGSGLWLFMDKPDFTAVKAMGYSWVAIRGLNADGTNAPVEAGQEANWKAWRTEAGNAGLKPLLWTYWYGPSEGVTGDEAAYLMACAKFTVQKIQDPSFSFPAAIIIDVEDKHLDGLAAAARYVRETLNVPVFLSPPGNPISYGTGARAVPTSATGAALAWDWAAIQNSVDGIMWQTYTGAWQGSPTIDGVVDAYKGFQEAMVEVALLGAWYNDPKHSFPVSDETDLGRQEDWKQAARSRALIGTSIWRYGSAPEATVAAFPTVPVAPPGPSPEPAPSPAPVPAPIPPVNPPGFEKLRADIEWLCVEWERIFGVKRPT